jgi:hypothetical protein
MLTSYLIKKMFSVHIVQLEVDFMWLFLLLPSIHNSGGPEGKQSRESLVAARAEMGNKIPAKRSG